ncbi:protoporphyrinogen oxidase [Candidatus Viridilinea mediisalina]|uniref:Coproporphyrinogen III oxidase n=1 Tax=Candidatus Viridilinea mediisalina TaxID=2024553 RepID=A0A2A6RJA9_9CHLR|nr:protoporphyrinogen oxidase [Candidatus Viridilinea mediisalina]PDW02975.1 protoporphyrinogen oxidase [Candidatus Viridilinea mediisalina]
MQSYDVIIVGAGISGMSAAYTLYKRGLEVLVLEASAEVGGAMRSHVTADGYTFDCGPNTLATRDVRLWSDFGDLGLRRQMIVAGRSGKRRYFLQHGKPLEIPSSPVGLVRTPLLPFAAKLQMLREPFVPRSGSPDESVASFFSRRLGPEAMQRLVDPFVSGVYSGDPEAMSVKAAFPSLWEAERRAGSVIKGMLSGQPKAPKDTPKEPKMRSVTFSFQGGIATWPTAIARTLGPQRVWSQARASDIFQEGGLWRVVVERADGPAATVEARAVILATPAFNAAELVTELDKPAATALREIPYSSMAVVNLGYRRNQVAHPLDGFGVLAPSCEKRNFLGILWASSLFPPFAPADRVSTITLMGGALNPIRPEQSREELIASAIRDNEQVLGASGEPEVVHYTRWPTAIPQYNFGHDERIATLERLEQTRPGIYFLGSYRGGVGVPKCWKNAVELADRIADTLVPHPVQVTVE